MTSRYDSQIDVTLPNNTHASLVRLAGENHRILELGAASGYMTAILKERGNTVTAVEYDPVAAAALEGVANEAIIADLNDPKALADIGGPFDVVLAGDVLEHLLDPAGVLASAVSKLTPDGAVVMSLPNVTHIDLRLALLQGRFEYQPTGLLDDTHVRFFTYDSMLTLVGGAGLLITDIERITTQAFESEIFVDRDEISSAVLADALSVPEAETYQFVVRAVIDHGDETARRRSASLLTTERDKAIAAQGIRATGPVGQPLTQQLEEARGFLAQAEQDRDAARTSLGAVQASLDQANAELASTRGELIALRQEATANRHDIAAVRQELMAAREELAAACVAEARARAEIAEQRAASTELERVAASALSDQASLAELVNSRAFRAVSRYRRAVNRVAPVGSRRRAALRPIAHIVRP